MLFQFWGGREGLASLEHSDRSRKITEPVSKTKSKKYIESKPKVDRI